MKNYVLLFLVYGIVAQNAEKKDYDKGRETDFDEDDDYGNPDIYGLIERPCPVYDRFCIRGFFAKHSYCKIVPGPVEEPFYITEYQINLPSINTSVTTNDNRYRGLNGLIQDFYINKATGNLVLSVFFEGVIVETPATYFMFFRNGQTAITLNDFTSVNYRKMTTTIVIPNYEDLRLDRAEITGYLDDPFPPQALGPAIVANPDPIVQSAILELLTDVPKAVRSNMLTIGPLVGKIFVQRNICDFGLPINKIGYDTNVFYK